MSHTHLDAPASRLPRRLRVVIGAALFPFVVATLVGLVVLWPRHAHPTTSRDLAQAIDLQRATVEDVSPTTCPGVPRCFDAFIRVTSGPDRGGIFILGNLNFGPGTPVLHLGDRIVVGRSVDPTNGHVDYYFSDFQRRTPLLLLAGLFALVVVAVARWRGLAAIGGLAVAWVVLVRFAIPDILEGRSPVAVSLVAGALILFVVMYLAHGVNGRTSIALLGTLGSLALTGALAAAFVAASRLTGLSSDEATYLQVLTSRVSLTGLVLAGIVIGSLGVLNDVTVTQASAVWEIHEANPRRAAATLYRSGMRVGRDHIASVVYTLVLAYAGASLPLLIVFTLSNQRLGNVLTSDMVAEEIVRTLVGSIGLVASVPITTALASFVVTRAAEPRTSSSAPDSRPGPRLRKRRRDDRTTPVLERPLARPPTPTAPDPPEEPRPWRPPRRERLFRDEPPESQTEDLS